MDELHKFLFEGLPVRGMLVRLGDSWREVLRRREPVGAFPPRSLLLGAPAKVARELTDKDLQMLENAADSYVRRARLYRESLRRVEGFTTPALPTRGEV